MKLLKLIFPLTMLMFLGQSIKAQDLHFSNYQMLPVQLNPALSGGFNGTVRASVMMRGQWWSVAGGNPLSGNGYNTLGVSIDSPVIRGLRKRDWIGVGIDYSSDKAGAGNYGVTATGINLAYHFSLDKKQTRVLTLGLKRAGFTYSLDSNGQLISRPTLLTGADADINALFQNAQMDKIDNAASDFEAGLVLTTTMGKSSDLRAGIAVSNILKHTKSPTGFRDSLSRGVSVFATLYNSIGKNFVFKPSVFIQRQNVTMEMQIQGMGSYLFKPESDLWLNFGLGLRPMNSADLILFLGADIKDIRVGLSYDVNFAGFTSATGTVGAMELGVSYIYKLFKKPKVDPTLICPRL